jgi:pilus assembly protein Flp/PilA
MQTINEFMMGMLVRLSNLSVKREEGQTLVEYALIIALISVALVVALGTLKGGINNAFTAIKNSLG